MQRLALPGSLSEVDIVRHGSNVYYYDSATQQVTDYTGAGQAPPNSCCSPVAS